MRTARCAAVFATVCCCLVPFPLPAPSRGSDGAPAAGCARPFEAWAPAPPPPAAGGEALAALVCPPAGDAPEPPDQPGIPKGLAKLHQRRAQKAEAASVDFAALQAALSAALEDFAALPADASPKQHKQAVARLQKRVKAVASARRRAGRALTRLEQVTAKILAIAPEYFSVPAPHSVAGLDVPLLVHEALPADISGTDRPDAVATFGLPFARELALPVVEGRPQLGVLGSDLYQFRVLDTWPEGTARWVLCDVGTSLAADQVRDDLVVVAGGGASGQADVAQRSTAHILLDTGPLQVVLAAKSFQLFQSIIVDGQLVVFDELLPGLVGRNLAGEALLPAPHVKAQLEENGPARAVVRLDATLAPPGGGPSIDVTCRVTARRGSRTLELGVTLRNAQLDQPIHTQLESVELIAHVRAEGQPFVRVATPDGEVASPLQPDASSTALYYQAHTDALAVGLGSNQYRPHLPLLPGSTHDFVQEGTLVELDGVVHEPLGDKTRYARHPTLDLSGPSGGITVAIRNMPFLWPAALAARGDGMLSVGLFPQENPAPYTFAWRQHESRTAALAFHGPDGGEGAAISRRLDTPVSARAADYGHYDRAGVFPYELLTRAEHEQALQLMGIDHVAAPSNPDLSVTRYLYKGTTGGMNNHDSIEVGLGGDWLRNGTGGSYLNALDLALYKCEWQIMRSDGFHHAQDPGAQNESLPHSTGYRGDDEHRYREGIALAYRLTGDTRFSEALFDEAEILPSVSIWPHERSMYQTLRATAAVHDFTRDDALLTALRTRLEYFALPVIDVHSSQGGFGGDAAPGSGVRGYFVNSSDNDDEKPPGEHFQARGFISASLGPLAMYHAARVLPGEALGAVARGRLHDLSRWTADELFPSRPDPADQRLVYSYAVTLQQVTTWENTDFHPILLGMAECFRDTGDTAWLDKGVEQLRAAWVHGDLHRWNTRLDCQHFLSVYRDHALGL